MTPVTRSLVILRSSSANTRIIFKIASPIAVDVSNCSFSEINVTRYFLNSSYMREKSTRFRLIRSILCTTTFSTLPALMSAIMRWKPGRSVFFPETPASS